MIGLDSILDGVSTAGICGHVKPDGDAYGSCMGLYLFLKTYYPHIRARVYLEDNYPESFRFVSCSEEIIHDYPKEEAHDVFFALDCSDLMRLGFSQKQAESIDNYRKKGGRFRRSSDFAKSYVVSDSVFKRLEPFISIPKIDINKADSAAFDSLPGIGGWFASRMVEYRRRLHGYSCPEQLLEIYRFDRDRYDGLRDLITCSPAPPYPLWSLPVDSLRLHPHIGSWQTARAIVFFREHNPREKWTVDALLGAGILSEEQAAKLRLCKLE